MWAWVIERVVTICKACTGAVHRGWGDWGRHATLPLHPSPIPASRLGLSPFCALGALPSSTRSLRPMEPTGTNPQGLWSYTPSKSVLQLWHRCLAGELCPPVFLLVDLGPRPYGKGSCLRAFEEYVAEASNLPGGDGYAYNATPLKARRPVLTGACAQFEGFVGASSPYLALSGSVRTPAPKALGALGAACASADGQLELRRAPQPSYSIDLLSQDLGPPCRLNAGRVFRGCADSPHRMHLVRVSWVCHHKHSAPAAPGRGAVH